METPPAGSQRRRPQNDCRLPVVVGPCCFCQPEIMDAVSCYDQ
jgi:hypothetical protein